MKYLALLISLLLLTSMTACAKDTTPARPDVVDSDTETPVDEPVAPPLMERKADPNVAKLFDKTGTVKSYKFDLYDYSNKKVKGAVYIKGDRAKITLILPQTVEKNAPDTVFLNMKDKTAREYCTDNTRCDPVMGWDVEYSKHSLTLPTEWTENLKYGTNTKSLTFYSRTAQVIQYEAEGRWYEGYVDNYYGFPLRVAIATDKEMTNIIGGYEYRSIAFNSVSDSDVTAPTI